MFVVERTRLGRVVFLRSSHSGAPMKKLAWSAGFAVFAAVAGAGSACTVTTDNGDGGGTGVVAPDDAGGQPDATTQEDTGTTTSAEAATDDGGSCSLGVDTGNPACDSCVESSCCDTLVACDTGAASNSTASECEDIASCYGDCLFPPADSGQTMGTPSDCSSLCSTSHSTQSVTAFTNLQNCITTGCATQCQ